MTWVGQDQPISFSFLQRRQFFDKPYSEYDYFVFTMRDKTGLLPIIKIKMNSLFEYASSLSRETKWHGNHAENDNHLILKAGRISMVYENGNLRSISTGNTEIIRIIYSAVRDKEWLTIKPVISEEEFDLLTDSFRIRYQCRYKSGEIDFSARYTIEGNSDNSLIFSFEGETMNTFEKNRIGFCIQHPIEGYAGEICEITHSNNGSESLNFPLLISPLQPFTDIKSMKWKIFNHNCTLDFYGDVFESEDQRNWTDASYKTYCTPLNRPFPIKLQKGEQINQKIEFKLEAGSIQGTVENNQITITIEAEKTTGIPLIGIGRSTRHKPITEEEIKNLKNLKFDHYRVDLYLFNPGWKSKADLAACEAVKLEYSVEFALFFDDDALAQTAEFIEWINVTHPKIVLIILYHKTHPSTPDLLTDTIAPILKSALPGVKIGCGTNSNFAQLNRNRPESVYNDLICYSIHPQEHASDNTTLTENLQAQGYTVKSAAEFANGKELWISPVNIQRRFNANIQNYEQTSEGGGFPPQVDSRLMSLFGAAWTIGSLKYLSEAGIKGVTFFETVGERGTFQGEYSSSWPEMFKSIKGMIFPLYHVFKYILNNNSLKVIKSLSSHPLKVDCLLLSDGNNLKLILTNFTSSQQRVIFEGCSSGFTIKQLNAETFINAVSDINWIENARQIIVNPNEHLVLDPFSVSFIEGWVSL